MKRRYFFLLFPLFLSLLFTSLLIQIVDWDTSNILIEALWLVILTILNYSLFLVTLGGIFSFFSGHMPMVPRSYIQDKKVVLLYSVKNEDNLLEKIYQNINNNLESISELVIISNSTSDRYSAIEKSILWRIKQDFDIKVTHYPSRPPKHIGIYSFVQERSDVEFIATCDADTIYPKDTIKQLMMRAYHPSHSRIALWQSHSIATKGTTRFGRIMGEGQDLAAKLYGVGFATALGESGYYGSGALISRQAFSEVAQAITSSGVIPTEDIKSHDVWEATILMKLGYHTRYVSEVVTYEDFPQTYLEMISRDRRWMKGTLQSILSLKVLPHKNTLATYFFVLSPIYMYLIQPVYLVWVLIGIIRLFTTTTTSLDLQVILIITVMAILFLQKYLAVRSLKDILRITQEQVLSTLFYINTPLFTSRNLFHFFVKEEWIPTAKYAKQYPLITIINRFMVNQIIGFWGILFIYFSTSLSMLLLFPIFIMYLLSGIVTYFFQFEVIEQNAGVLQKANT